MAGDFESEFVRKGLTEAGKPVLVEIFDPGVEAKRRRHSRAIIA